MSADRRRLALVAALVAGLLLAVGVPAVWWASRPDPTAGAPVAPPLPGPTTAGGAAGSSSTGPGGTGPGAGTAPQTLSAAIPSVDPVTPPPVSVRIGSLGVNAQVDPAGLLPDGSMAIPEAVSQVGWYRYGPAPGDPGSVVLAGHVDSAKQGRGALYSLRDIAVGARIELTTAAGRTVRYQVTGLDTIVKQRLPVERIFTREGPSRLVIITCGGPFLPQFHSYQDNLVVVAVPEG